MEISVSTEEAGLKAKTEGLLKPDLVSSAAVCTASESAVMMMLTAPWYLVVVVAAKLATGT